MLSSLSPDTLLHIRELERRLHELDAMERRFQARHRIVLERVQFLRRRADVCPKCGQTGGLFTDSGAGLVRVLEDPTDTELLEPGKPLYCTACGDVFLYAGQPVATPPRRKSA